MRAGIGTALVTLGALLAKSGIAQVNQEQAFNLCIAQPLLKSDFLMPLIEEKLAKPHDPALDYMSKAQLLNATQYYQGTACAADLVAHPDAFSVIAGQQFVSHFAWELAWGAFNTECRQNLTGACIKNEIDAGVAVQEANSHGMTSSSRACSLVLLTDIDFVQWKACMDAVGDQHPDEVVILGCAASAQFHSQNNGALAGRKIGECLKKGG